MSYHPNIPNSTDDPSVSQGQLKDNFSKINTDFTINHVALTAGGNNGYHKLVQFDNVQSNDPTVTGNQSAVYAKAISSTPQLFFNNSVGAKQLTNLPVVNGTITNITQAANAVLTSTNHGLSNGASVTISNVAGMTQVNGNTYVISGVTANTFELNVNSLAFGAYTSGGTWTSSSSTRFGFVTPWGWTVNCGKFTMSGASTTQNYSIPYSGGSTIYTMQLSTASTGAFSWTIAPVSATQFSAIATTANKDYYYLIIGSS